MATPPPALAVGAMFSMDAATVQATYGANASGTTVSINNLLAMKHQFDNISPQQMIDPVEQGGLGWQMTLEQAQSIKDGLAEADANLRPAMAACAALSRAAGLGV